MKRWNKCIFFYFIFSIFSQNAHFRKKNKHTNHSNSIFPLKYLVKPSALFCGLFMCASWSTSSGCMSFWWSLKLLSDCGVQVEMKLIFYLGPLYSKNYLFSESFCRMLFSEKQLYNHHYAILMCVLWNSSLNNLCGPSSFSSGCGYLQFIELEVMI